MINRLRKIKALTKQFGIVFSIKYCLYKFGRKDEKYIQLVYDRMYDILKPLIKKYENTVSDCIFDNSANRKISVWVCWWQGYDNMPELCRLCYNRLSKMLPENSELRLITLNNYENYVNIPEYIKEKFTKGYISMTAFSDVLRNYLIKENGGFWIDSTIFVSSALDADFMANVEWWSIKAPIAKEKIENLGQKITARKWSSFIQKGVSGNKINSFVSDAFALYFQKYDFLIDYFQQNLCIKIAYDHIPAIHDMIEKVPISNVNVYSLYDHIDEAYNPKQYAKWNNGTQFYKLTYKRRYERETSNGALSWYGFFEDICNSGDNFE